MNKWLFIAIVALLFAGVPYCAYQSWNLSQAEADQQTTVSMISENNSSANQQGDWQEAMNGEMETMKEEKIGYLGATAVLFVIPSLMLLFRRRLIS